MNICLPSLRQAYMSAVLRQAYMSAVISIERGRKAPDVDALSDASHADSLDRILTSLVRKWWVASAECCMIADL